VSAGGIPTTLPWLPSSLLKRAFLQQRCVDEIGRVRAGGFAAQAFEQSFDTFEIDAA